MVTACDYCSERSAVLYCRADSARLCLPCDKHVHSANALSGKHRRSQICENCSAAPASVRCSTDNLLLCPDCDFDAHPLSSEHLRCPAPVPFSGCPSPLDLASAWGLDIVITTTQEDKKKNEMKLNAFQCGGLIDHELMVPNCNRASSSFGKQGQVIVKQLLELLADGAEELRPRAPNGGGQWNGQEDLLLEQENEQEEIGGGEFTKLLMMQTAANVPKGEGDGNLLWNANTSTRDHSSQIWDFKLGQLRGHDESGSLELDFGGSDMEYLTKSYSELLKEASGTRRGGLDFPGVSCSFEHEEMIPFNGALNNQTASQGPATSESNNIAASFSGFNRPKSYGCSKDIQFTDESILIKSESGAAATTKADLELLAKNRGNAMQRYMEKKKNRRYDKQIRYESRKARADTRKRVKGRFVKASDTREG